MVEPTIDEILKAAQHLYEHGDGGFSDVDFVTAGAILKSQPKQSRQIWSLWTILKPYRTKLTELGLDFESFVPPDPFIKGSVQSKVTIGARVSLKKVETKTGSRVAISAPYDEHLVKVIKTLKGREFDKEGQKGGVPFAWLIPSTPVDIEMAIATLKAENCVLDVDPALKALVEVGKVSYQESRAHTAEIVIPTKLPLYPFQRAGVKWIDDHNGRALVSDEMGLGKAQPIDALVMTPDGWKQIGQLVCGSNVIGANGSPTKIVGVFPQGQKEIYKVIFSDGSSAECCDDHLWNVNSACRKSRGNPFKTETLSKIRKKLFDAAGNARHYIPLTQSIVFTRKELPLDPYLLGALIGNGSLTGRIAISLSDEDGVKLVQERLPVGMHLRHHAAYDYAISSAIGVTTSNPVQKSIRDLGLDGYSEDKFIPEVYKYGSIEQRLELLHGLMDTDGYVSQDGKTIQYTSVSKCLIQDVAFLVQSFGGTAKESSKIPTFTHKGERKEGQRAYTLTINLPRDIEPFSLARKKERLNGRGSKYLPTRAIVSVEKIETKESVCIKVEAADGLYLTSDFIVTHNTPQSLGYLVLRPERTLPALVLCPPLVRVTWYRAVSKFTDLKPLLVAGKTSLPSFKKAGLDVSLAPLAGYDITITNYDLLAVETPRTWLRNLLSPKKELQVYGEKHLAWAGLQAQELLENAMKKYTDIDSRNRINRVLELIKAQGSRARKIRDPEYKLVFVNDIPFEEFVKAGYKTLISDESHYLKEITAQRTIAALEISTIVQNSICLTGTPIDNRPRELWSQTQIVNRSIFPKFFDYGLRHCGAFQKPAAQGKMVWDFSGVSNIAELDKTLRSTIMIRRTKDQVMKELPPKTRTMIPFVVEDSQDKLYRKEETGAMDRLRKIRKDREEWRAVVDALPEADRKAYAAKHAEKAARQAGLKNLAIAEIEKLKEAAVNAKFAECIEFTAGLQETQGKVLVFAVHHDTIDRIVAAFKEKGIKTDYVDGRVTGMDRQNVLDSFQEGDLEILVCGIRAVSIGVTLVASHTVAFIELDWTPGIHAQAEDRVHRPGQLKPVTVYYLLLLGSVEEKIARMIDAKREIVNSILGEGDRTIQEAGILDAVLDELLDEKKAA